jgi:hypothetical protein
MNEFADLVRGGVRKLDACDTRHRIRGRSFRK